jgi:hypothetical protein
MWGIKLNYILHNDGSTLLLYWSEACMMTWDTTAAQADEMKFLKLVKVSKHFDKIKL